MVIVVLVLVVTVVVVLLLVVVGSTHGPTHRVPVTMVPDASQNRSSWAT